MKLGKDFFERSAEVVAEEILGKILVRNFGGKKLKAKIVETEAYFDEEDPSSRACKNGDIKKTMEMSAGTILIYGVHNNWLMNFVTNKTGKAEAVLIRALEPLNSESNFSGPGLLTKNFGINKNFHKTNISKNADFWIEDSPKNFEVVRKFRVGVKKDLLKQLRFYIKNNKYISRK